MAPDPGPRDPRLTLEAHAGGASVRIVLRGDADVSTLDDLRTELAAITLDGARSVELDVSDLEFIDVAVLRHVTLFAVGLRQTGYEVHTQGATPMLRHLIELFGVADELGIDGTGGSSQA